MSVEVMMKITLPDGSAIYKYPHPKENGQVIGDNTEWIEIDNAESWTEAAKIMEANNASDK